MKCISRNSYGMLTKDCYFGGIDRQLVGREDNNTSYLKCKTLSCFITFVQFLSNGK